MSYVNQDLPTQVRGDTWILTFKIVNSSNTAIDITGNNYWLTLKSNIDLIDNNAEIQIGPVAAGSPDSTQGLITITVPSSNTVNLAPGYYNYDLQEVESDNTVNTLILGKVKVKADVTRSIS